MLCRFGPVRVEFKDFPVCSLWPFSLWKLDPFKAAEGDADITVDCHNGAVTPSGEPIWSDIPCKVIREVYKTADGGILWQQTDSETKELQLQFTVSADYKKVTLTWDNSSTAGVAPFEALTFLIYYSFLHRQVLTLHGAIVEEGGRGFLLCGQSGIGKTTHARLWRDSKDALIINGDRAACFEEDGRWYAFGTPWCGTGGEYVNRRVPLQAVVILDRGEENRVSASNSLSLLPHAVYPCWDKEAAEKMLLLLDGLSASVPVLRLECTNSVAAVDELYKALENLPL